jgi:hypothetical protein
LSIYLKQLHSRALVSTAADQSEVEACLLPVLTPKRAEVLARASCLPVHLNQLPSKPLQLIE